MTRHADADRPSHARVVKRREQDLVFLDRVRTATLEELQAMSRCYRWGWRRVAIARRIKMAEGGMG